MTALSRIGGACIVLALWAGSATLAQEPNAPAPTEPPWSQLVESIEGVADAVRGLRGAQEPSRGNESREIRDVIAQEGMENWALWMVVVSGLGTVVSIFALVGLFRSLRHTRMAINLDQTIGFAEARAYVYAEGVRFTWHENKEKNKPPFIRLHILWQNSGNTPTRDLTLYSCRHLMPGDIPEDYGFLPEADTKYIPIQIPPKGQIAGEKFDVTSEQIQSVIEGKSNLYVWGIATYKDVFSPATGNHITRCCHLIDRFCITGNPRISPDDEDNGLRILPKLYGNHNCADDECKSFPTS